MIASQNINAVGTTAFSGFAALAIAVYLGLVVYNGNVTALMAQLKTEVPFLKWGVALLVLYFVRVEIGGALGAEIVGLVLLALLLVTGATLFPAMKKFFTATGV